nr:MAG TPA: hypothetical protein [Bacteriophage sp.]
MYLRTLIKAYSSIHLHLYSFRLSLKCSTKQTFCKVPNSYSSATGI